MATIAQLLGKGITTTAGLGWRGTKAFAKTGMPAYVAGGALAGGMIGAFRGDTQNFENTLGSITRHALVGATTVGGLGLGKKALGLIGARNVGRGATGAGKMGLSAATRAGQFVAEHPFLIGGGIGAAYAGVGIAGYGRQSIGTSPTLSGVEMNVNYNTQAIAAQEMMSAGVSPTGGVMNAPQYQNAERRRMMESTQGLGFGLHKGRHG